MEHAAKDCLQVDYNFLFFCQPHLKTVATLPCEICTSSSSSLQPRAGSGVVRMGPIRFLAGCHTRRLNQG